MTATAKGPSLPRQVDRRSQPRCPHSLLRNTFVARVLSLQSSNDDDVELSAVVDMIHDQHSTSFMCTAQNGLEDTRLANVLSVAMLTQLLSEFDDTHHAKLNAVRSVGMLTHTVN